MTPARALPALALFAALSAAAAAPATPPAATTPPAAPAPPSTTGRALDSPDSVNLLQTTPSSRDVDGIKYPTAWRVPERPGWGEGSPRIFSQLVIPFVQLVINQLLQATNLAGALAGAGRPDAVLSFFSTSIGAATAGGAYPARRPAPPIL